jgi:alpha-mannosidase
MLSNVLHTTSHHMASISNILTSLLGACGGGCPHYVFNTCSFDRSHLFVADANGRRELLTIKGFSFADIPEQHTPQTHGSMFKNASVSVHSCHLAAAATEVERSRDGHSEASSDVNGGVYLRTHGTFDSVRSYVVGNGLIEVALSSNGAMESLVDKRTYPPRQVLQQHFKKGKDGTSSTSGSGAGISVGNHYVLYDDIPFYWDAWDVMPYHQMTGRSLNGANMITSVVSDSRVVVLDEHMAKVEFTLSRWGEMGTALIITVTIVAGSPLVEFNMDVFWHEKHKLLKVEFPLAVRAPVARFETQFGHTERPTHSNQPTDAAMFETCGHKYGDLSESGYGVALLNDCKYGYSCRGSTLCLSLLRSPKAPDADCDMGKHTIRYGIYPHVGSIQDCVAGRGVVQAASLFNSPLLVGPSSLSNPPRTLPRGDMTEVRRLLLNGICVLKHAGGLVMDSLKAEELWHIYDHKSDSKDRGDGARRETESESGVIVRLYESVGSRGTAVLGFNMPVRSVHRCNMSEEPISQLLLSEIHCGDDASGVDGGDGDGTSSGGVERGTTVGSSIKKKKSKAGGQTRREVFVEYSPFEVITLRLRF